MEFLEYSNQTQTNIFPKENFEILVQDVFNVISENICKSLGPLGSSATILEGLMPPEATKDGYAILNTYRFRNDYKKMIYNLIKAPCTKMNNTVGDGTTTAIALTTAMFNRYKGMSGVLETLYRLPRQFTRVWDETINELQEAIMSKATPIDPKNYDTIYHIAYVTSNGNTEISDAIAKVYAEAESPFIKQKDSPTNRSYIEVVKGFNFPANLISDAYARNQDMTAEENDIYVMVFDFKLETDFVKKVIIPINDVCKAKGKKLLVIAPMFDAKMCDELLAQYVMMERRTTGINLILAQYSMSDMKPNQLLDLCAILKTKIINENIAATILSQLAERSIDQIIEMAEADITYELNRMIGHADYAMLSISAGTIVRSDDAEQDEIYQDTLRSAKNRLEDIIRNSSDEIKGYSGKIYEARERVLQLEMKNYIYYIGADSQLQKNILWDSINDVIKCVRSAVKYGVVPGCQLTIIRSCMDMMNALRADTDEDGRFKKGADQLKYEILHLIKTACCDVYARVLHGPENMGMVKLLPRWNFTTEEGVRALTEEAAALCQDTINKSIEQNQVFDLETLEFNSDIITSAETDKMVLLAASELVKVLISGNQCIIIRADVDASHEETKEVYV